MSGERIPQHPYFPPIDSQPAGELRKVANFLRTFRATQDEVSGTIGKELPAASPYRRYLAAMDTESGYSGSWGDGAPRNSVRSMAISLGVFGAEALTACGSLLQTGDYFTAIYAPLRSAIEAHAQTAMILDPGLPDRQRAIRSAWILHDTAANARHGAFDTRQARLHRAERNSLRELFDRLVSDPTSIEVDGYGRITNVQCEEMTAISIEATVRALGSKLGFRPSEFGAIYGDLCALTHPTSRRVQALYELGRGTFGHDEDAVAALLSRLRVAAITHCFSIEQQIVFFGLEEDLAGLAIELIDGMNVAFPGSIDRG